MDADRAEAERLKVQGNELYQRGEHEAAHHKYSEAIKKDPKNAILYANRAATLLARKEYMDAACDCQKATDLDPTYAKAWGRYGAATHALAAWSKCIRAWEMALKSLPTTGLTPAHKTMKVQFEEGLAKAQVAQEKIETNAVTINVEENAGKMPWDVAIALRPAKIAAQSPSCVFVIAYAHEEFTQALQALDEVKIISGPINGSEFLAGPITVFELMTNAILTDERVFHMTSGDLLERLGKQAIFENRTHGGFLERGGPAFIMEEALKKLKTGGWKAARPAITITIRVWIYNAFSRSRLMGQHDVAHELYTRALDILEWGRKQWPDIPKEDRGAIFEKSFMRGIKRLHLQTMLSAVAARGDASGFTLDDLIESAKDLIEDADSDVPNPLIKNHMGHFLAFWAYPKGRALSLLGWVHLRKGMAASGPAKASHFMTAGEYYKEAAQSFPTDEQDHGGFFQKYLECLCLAGRPLKETLPVCEHMRQTLLEALEIWSTPPHGDYLAVMVEQATTFEYHYLNQIESGRCTLDSVGELPPQRPMPKLPRPKMLPL